MFIRETTRKIIEDITNNPHNWNTDDDYIMTNGEVKIWIASGVYGIDISYDTYKCKIFNYFERRAIYKCYEKLYRQRDQVLKERTLKRILESLNK